MYDLIMDAYNMDTPIGPEVVPEYIKDADAREFLEEYRLARLMRLQQAAIAQMWKEGLITSCPLCKTEMKEGKVGPVCSNDECLLSRVGLFKQTGRVA